MALLEKDIFLSWLRNSRGECASGRSFEDTCSICYQAPCDVETACQHVYCFDCLSHWLESRNTCPNCRTKLYEKAESSESSSSDSSSSDSSSSDSSSSESGANEHPWRDEVINRVAQRAYYFGAQEDAVAARVRHILDHGLPQASPDHPAFVDYDALLPLLVAITVFTDMRDEHVYEGFEGVNGGIRDGMEHTFNAVEDGFRRELMVVLLSAQRTLQQLHSMEMTCGELMDALVAPMHRAVWAEQLSDPNFPDNETRLLFRSKVASMVEGIVSEARRLA